MTTILTRIYAQVHVHEKAHKTGATAGVSETRPHFYGHRERLRGRFREAGADSVSDYELLELVLFRAIPQRDVKLLAKDLIARFGSFPEVISAPPARLAETKGIGEAVITELKVVHAAASRLARVRSKNGRCCRPGRGRLSTWPGRSDRGA